MSALVWELCTNRCGFCLECSCIKFWQLVWSCSWGRGFMNQFTCGRQANWFFGKLHHVIPKCNEALFQQQQIAFGWIGAKFVALLNVFFPVQSLFVSDVSYARPARFHVDNAALCTPSLCLQLCCSIHIFIAPSASTASSIHFNKKKCLVIYSC